MLQIGEGNESYYYLDYYKWISAYKERISIKLQTKLVDEENGFLKK